MICSGFGGELPKGGWPMSLADAVVVVGVLALWALAAYAVWLWGPGWRRRSVWCPVFKTYAKVLAEQKEAGFPNSYAGLVVLDVKRCSLYDSDVLRCHKECLAQL
jgi:hypothetical protein